MAKRQCHREFACNSLKFLQAIERSKLSVLTQSDYTKARSAESDSDYWESECEKAEFQVELAGMTIDAVMDRVETEIESNVRLSRA